MLSRELIDVSKIITHEYKLENYKEAFELSKSGRESIKVILKS